MRLILRNAAIDKLSSRTITILRLTALGLLIGGLYFVSTLPGVRGYFELEYLREMTAGSGFAGVAIFLVLWVVAYLMQIPGVVFVIAAALGWGTYNGGLISFVGLTLSTSASFWAIRMVGGSPVSKIENSWARKVLDQLDDAPVRTVTILRTLFLVNPVINISLVLTGVRFRDYLLGSMLGFIAPVAVISLATETVMIYFVG